MYNNEGISIINANRIGNNTVQQNDISWSNLILGNDALTQMKTNTIIELFIPKVKPYNNPSKLELQKNKDFIKTTKIASSLSTLLDIELRSGKIIILSLLLGKLPIKLKIS